MELRHVETETRQVRWISIFLMTSQVALADSTLVFNEVMYHPATGEAELEWVELYSQMSVDLDISGWFLGDGVFFRFAEGTVVPGGGYVVVAISPDALERESGYEDAFGPFVGRLENSGERLELRNRSGRLMDFVRYRDDGDWPVAPDGSGVSLAKLEPHTASRSFANWAPSAQIGGTPGRENFGSSDETTRRVRFVESGADARALVPSNGALATAWTAIEFDDSSWISGLTGVGYELFPLSETSYTELLGIDVETPMAGVNSTCYVRVSFAVADVAQVRSLVLRMQYDDGFVAYLNGREVVRANAPESLQWDSAAVDSNSDNRALVFEDFDISAFRGSLESGANVLAIHALNRSAANNDFLILPELVADVVAATDGSISLRINEISAGGSGDGGDFWVELLNTGPALDSLDGYRLEVSGSVRGEYRLPATELAAGAFRLIREEDLGVPPMEGDKLFLFRPDGSVADAAEVEAQPVARWLDGDPAGSALRWLRPSRPTPAAQNEVEVRDEIVINEIFYHPREVTDAEGPRRTVLVPLDASWRYDDSGEDRGAAWRAPDFDDSAWSRGRALLYREDADLPGPKNTLLELGAVTHYFRSEFDLDEDPASASLEMSYVIDDGAAFYLNGVELERIDLPDGPLDSSTVATRAVPNASLRGPVALPSGALRRGRNVVAVEVHQISADSSDVVFGMELEATITRPPRDRAESWVELFNRSEEDLELSGWSLDRGINFEFADGTTIAAGGFLVVAQDRESFSSRYPGIDVVGDFTGVLSRASDRLVLRDALGNPADEVRYFDSGRWPSLADGGGSSLELQDPFSDNSVAESWAASDESERAAWQTYSYTKVANQRVGPDRWQELIVGLLYAGEVLLDDISVVESPGGAARQLLRNGDFESGDDHWRFLGNHRHTRVLEDPEDPGNHVLHLIASGPTEHMHNHLETTLVQSLANGREYEISFRARWLAGSNQLHTRLYFNRSARSTRLAVPDRTGTPGAVNSVFHENAGPTFSDVKHSPASPEAIEPVQVSAVVSDPNGVASCTLWWRVNDGSWRSSAMGRVPNGRWEGRIPAQARGTVVQFYVEATDDLDAVSTFPRRGRDSRALYRVRDGSARDRMHNFRIVMTASDLELLYTRTNLMSNERLGATVIYREEEIYYDVGVRLKGSQRGRPDGSDSSFSVRFGRDRPFRGVHRSVSLDRSGGWASGLGPNGQDEIVFKHLVNAAGFMPGMYDDLTWVISPRRGREGAALLMMGKYTSVFLESAYPDGGDGQLYKMELIYFPTTTVNGRPDALKQPLPDTVIGTELRDLGNDKEDYRWTLLLENHLDEDAFEPAMRLSRELAGASESELEGLFSVDEVLRVYLLYTLCGVSDVYPRGGNAHNCMWLHLPFDGRFRFLHWDADVLWSGTTGRLWGGERLTDRLLRFPRFERRAWAHLADILEHAFNEDYASRWTQHYGALAGEDYARVRSFIASRAAFARDQLPARAPFRISTGGGDPIDTDELTIELAGTAPFTALEIVVGGDHDPLSFAWTSRDRWRMTVPLDPGRNEVEVSGIDVRGDIVGADSIVVNARPDSAVFIRGDANLDGAVDVGDAVKILFFLFVGAELSCEDAADANDDESISVRDAFRVLDYLFRDGSPPPEPFDRVGVDSAEAGALGCERGL